MNYWMMAVLSIVSAASVGVGFIIGVVTTTKMERRNQRIQIAIETIETKGRDG